MMKKVMAAMVVGAVLLGAGGGAAPKAEAAVLVGGVSDKKGVKTFKTDVSLEVLYDGRRIQFDVKPKIIDGSVLVPIRFVAEKMGGKLEVKLKDITITKNDKVIKLTMESKNASFNGKSVTLAQPAIVDRGRTLVPLRAISEGLGVNVEWDHPNQYVWIGSKDVPKIEDVIKPVDAKPYLKYYPKDSSIFTIFSPDPELNGKKKTTIRVARESDFPLLIGNGIIVYRIDKSVGTDKKDYIRFSSNSKGTMGNALFLMNSDSSPRLQSPYTKESVLNSVTLEYFPVDYYADKDTTWLKDIEYIGISLTSESLIAVKSDWR